MKKLHFLFLLVFVCSNLPAQTPLIDTTSVAIQPYDLAEVTQKVQVSNGLIQDARNYYNNRQDLDDVQSNFFQLDSIMTIAFLKIDTAKLIYSATGALIAQLSIFNKDIEGFEKSLNDRTTVLAEYRTKIKAELEIWELTRLSLVEDNSSQTVIGTVVDVEKRLDEIDKLIVDQIDVIFRSINGILERKVEIQHSLELLKSVADKTSQKIFVIDSSPIWRIGRDTLLVRNVGAEIAKNGRIAFSNTVSYVEKNIELFIINAVIIILLTILIIFLKVKQKKLIHYNDQKELWIMFNHPFGLAILLGLLVFAPPYEYFPEATGDFLVLVVYLIVTYIIFPIVNKKVKTFLLILAFFLTFNTLIHFVTEFRIVGRMLLLVQSFLGLYFVYSVLKPGVKSYNFLNVPVAKWMIYLLPLAFITFGLSAVTNLLGASQFTEFLLYSTTKSIALGILTFSGILVLNGMITILIRSPQANTMYLVKEHSEILENRTRQLLQIAMFAFFIVLICKEFNIWDDVLSSFNSALDYNLGYGEKKITFRGILAFFITIVATWWIAKLLRIILEKELFGRMNLPRGIPSAISLSIYYFIIAIGFFLALSQSGVDLSQISIIFGALSVGIGFGLQNIISNFISGIILAFERPIQEGDTIEVGSLMGEVKSIGIRSSKVRIFDGSEVIVPNNNLISNEVINWTLSDRKRRSTIEIGVAYGTNPRKVAGILEKIALDYSKTLKDPVPLIIFDGFGDSSLNFKVHFWTYFEDGYTSKSEVSMNIYDALNEAGIEIPFPQRVVTMKEPNEGRAQLPESKKQVEKKRKSDKNQGGRTQVIK